MSEPLDPRRCSFTFVCERKWEELTTLPGEEMVRHCDSCNKSVHWIEDMWEWMQALAENRCVVVDWRNGDYGGMVPWRTMGVVGPGPEGERPPILPSAGGELDPDEA